ncbi:MAG: DUF58 domain-containing protein [Wenzhouxiangellaceae bacterium]
MTAAMHRLRQARHRWLSRFLSKRGPITPPLTLIYQRIFILPTAFGWVFGLLLAVMTIGGLNFNNNLGLLLTFLLAASAHATLHMAYSTLRGIHIRAIEAQPVFAGEPLMLRIQLQETEQRPRPGLEILLNKERGCAHLAAGGQLTITIPAPTHKRGWLHPERLRIRTSYPLGLFVAWSWFESARPFLIYPAPAQDPPPLPRGASEQGPQLRLRDGDDLVGLRQYQGGDPLPSIAWKASARHQDLQTKLLATATGNRLVLDWQRLEGLPVERRLSVLCAWVLQAERGGHNYRLCLPGQELGPARGPQHRDDCLRALALFSS